MKKHLLYIILILSPIISSEIMDKTNNLIKETFPGSIIEHSIFKLDKNIKKDIQNKVRQRFFRDELNIWEITTKDTLKYYAILDNVKGKSLPITFLSIFNQKGTVFDTFIIKYRESYGGEVGNKNWLNQFIDYSDKSDYKVGSSISGISGATISVKSVTKGINKLSILIYTIIQNLNE